MVYKDEVCMWFKDSESHRRLELVCGLLNMCLPFELRFIRTCVEDLLKRDDLLRDFDSKANNSSEISQLGKILDERTRSKFVVYVALLEANNQTCSKILYETLSNAQQIPNSALSNNLNDNINYIKEMLLIYTMVLHHPAFTFEEKRVIGEKFQSLQVSEDQLTKNQNSWNCNKNFELARSGRNGNITVESCHPASSSQVYEACDSGLSIGTEPEVETLSDHVCGVGGVLSPHEQCNASIDNKFADNKTAGMPLLNPSIGTRNLGKPPSSSLVCSSVPTIIPIGPPKETDHHIVPQNRDASSSGSGESLDLYGETVSVPTTYIYNSNIYDQNISEMPALALGNNVINLTPGYMYEHNGRCHFYHYPPLMGGVLPPVSMPRKLLPQGLASETSSSEEGGGGSNHNSLQNETVSSPLNSLQSSPYVSPPQSLTSSRPCSPKESVTTVSSSHISNGFVTCSSTTNVISKSSPRTSTRQDSNYSVNGSNNSQPSSPAVSTSSQLNRTKPPMVTKNQKCIGDRLFFTSSSKSIDNCSEGTAYIMNGPLMLLASRKENGSADCLPTNKEMTSEEAKAHFSSPSKGCGKSFDCGRQINSSSAAITKSLPNMDKDNANGKSHTPSVSSSNFKNNCGNLPNVSPLVSLACNPSVATKDNLQTSPMKDVKIMKEKACSKDSSFKKGRPEETEKLKPSEHQDEKLNFFASLPNGFSEHLIANSFTVKNSSHNTPECSSSSTSNSLSSHNFFLPESNKQTLPNVSSQSKLKTSVPNTHHAGTYNMGSKVSINKHLSMCEGLPLNTLSQTVNVLPSHTPMTKQNTPSSDVTCDVVSVDDRIASMLTNTTKPLQQKWSVGHHGTFSPQPSGPAAKVSGTHTTSILINTSPSLGKYSSQTENGYHLQAPSTSTSSSSVSCNIVKTAAANTISATLTTTTSSVNSSIMSLVPTPGSYPPYFSLPMLPGGASHYLQQGNFPAHLPGHPPRTPSHALFLASSGMVHGNSGHVAKGHPHMMPPPGSNMNNKSRGGSSGRSGSSSSSSGGGPPHSRKKGFLRGNQYQNKSRSSDSSPSSSQYSSPPQTPSPDHTKENRAKPAGPPHAKQNEGFTVEEMWEQPSDPNGSLPRGSSRDDGTPPPPPPPHPHGMGHHIMIPSNPVRHRYIPYHPLPFIGYPHPHSQQGMYRYSIPSPSVMMGPRPPTPLSSEKSSRETTPPTQSHVSSGPPESATQKQEFSTASVVVVPATTTSTTTTTVAAAAAAPAPPPPGHLGEGGASVPIAPPPSGPPSGNMTSNIAQYNPPNYPPMFAMGTGPFVAHLSGFMPSNTGIPNGYVSPHTLPPNFPVPSIPNGINSSELVYPNPYPVVAQSNLPPNSSGGPHPAGSAATAVHHQSSGGHAPVLSPSPAALAHFSPLTQTPTLPPNPVPPPMKKPFTCYNCGKGGHRGSDCKEASIDEMTKRTKLL